MSQSDSKSSHSISQTNSPNHSVTSLRKECIDSLRFPGSKCGEVNKQKTHLLACMSEIIPEEPDFKIEEIEDFCSFDRMKRILEKRKVRSSHKNQEEAIDNEKLLKFIQIEAKMKKMENNLMKYTKTTKNDNVQEVNKKKSMKNSTSLANIFLSAPTDQQWKDPVVTDNDRKECNNLPNRHEMAKALREHGYRHYNEWQKKKLHDSENGVKEFVETEIEEKVKTMLEERDNKFNELLKRNKNLEKSILEKNLEIENLKSKQESLLKNVEQLENFKDLFSEENSKKNKEKQLFLEKFYEDFHECFSNETISSLKSYIDSLTDKCLSRFNDIECKKFDKWNEEKADMNVEIGKLNNNIDKLKGSENELLSSLKEFRYGQKVVTMEIDSLLSSKNELDKLQKKILSLYNDWYGNLSDGEKELMKNLGYLESSYEYEEMLEYIVAYKIKFSSDQKVNDYLIKILRGIQRIRKILFPKTISNTGEAIKMDPLFILEKLEKYVKCKMYQILKKGSTINKGSRMSQIVEEEFLGMTQESDEEEKEVDIPKPINTKSDFRRSFSINALSSKNTKTLFEKSPKISSVSKFAKTSELSKQNKENAV